MFQPFFSIERKVQNNWDVLQNIFFCAPQKKANLTALKQREGE